MERLGHHTGTYVTGYLLAKYVLTPIRRVWDGSTMRYMSRSHTFFYSSMFYRYRLITGMC
jgi:hypothetical protein